MKEGNASSKGQEQDKDVCLLLWLLTNIILTILAKKIKHEDEIKAARLERKTYSSTCTSHCSVCRRS